jgi:hypothetical protein
LSYEFGLFALAVLFYLYDSTVLLYSNEAVLTRTGGKWAANTGFYGFLFAGRTLCVLNPLGPHQPAYRLSWDFNALPPAPPAACLAESGALKILTPTSMGAAIGLFILLPLGMFTALGAFAVIPALILLYGSIIVSLILVRSRHILVAQDRKRFIALAFECLACPPFGVNMVRRTTLSYRISEPLPLAAVRLLDAASWATLRALCVSRLQDALQLAAADSNEEKLLEAQKTRLMALGGAA